MMNADPASAPKSVPSGPSVDAADVARFEALGAQWWDEKGPMKALHRFNPVRVSWLRDLVCREFPDAAGRRDREAPRPLEGVRVLDIGCGGGLLSEPLARLGAQVTGIDPAPGNVEVARLHAQAMGLAIDYRAVTAEELAASGAVFDVVLTMEVIEHVNGQAAFMKVAASLVRPGGLLAAATLSRTLKSFAFAIVGAEYVLGWVPRGTHDWEKFVRPDELAGMIEAGGLAVIEQAGVIYDPLAGRWRLGRDMDVNYMLAARRSK